jgi:hypothetical protein
MVKGNRHSHQGRQELSKQVPMCRMDLNSVPTCLLSDLGASYKHLDYLEPIAEIDNLATLGRPDDMT